MTEAVAVQEEKKEAPPRSLWGEAWSRLRKNRFAVMSLAWLSVIGIAAALAPWIVPYDPQHQEWWTGKRPPLYSHATLELIMTFSEGSAPPAPFPSSGTHVIKVKKEEARTRDLRIKVSHDGKVEHIELGPDLDADDPHSESPDVLALASGERIVAGEGEKRVAAAATTVEKGKVLPEPLAGAATGQAVLVAQWRKGERTREVEARVEQGKVASLAVDSKPEKRVEVAADEVLDVALDGSPFVHTHLLGTDDSGRDILSRIIFGGRISLMVGIVATLVSLVIGVAYGALSGYAGGRTDELMMRIVDILYAIPFMFFVIILLVLFGRSLILLFAAIGAVEWLTMARIVRGQVLSLKEKEFIEAARVSGTSTFGIVFGHLVPNSLGTVIVYTTLTIPEVILTEAFLSFLGLSVQYNGQNLESWGSLTKSGMDLALGGFPWLLLWSATALSLTLFALNFLGDGLRDALDPRLRGKG
ncbi:ABC transporter permease [bacterium]|nr:ABC transporter permease [bacterium]